jgi:hypothetical protein
MQVLKRILRFVDTWCMPFFELTQVFIHMHTFVCVYC